MIGRRSCCPAHRWGKSAVQVGGSPAASGRGDWRDPVPRFHPAFFGWARVPRPQGISGPQQTAAPVMDAGPGGRLHPHVRSLPPAWPSAAPNGARASMCCSGSRDADVPGRFSLGRHGALGPVTRSSELQRSDRSWAADSSQGVWWWEGRPPGILASEQVRDPAPLIHADDECAAASSRPTRWCDAPTLH